MQCLKALWNRDYWAYCHVTSFIGAKALSLPKTTIASMDFLEAINHSLNTSSPAILVRRILDVTLKSPEYNISEYSRSVLLCSILRRAFQKTSAELFKIAQTYFTGSEISNDLWGIMGLCGGIPERPIPELASTIWDFISEHQKDIFHGELPRICRYIFASCTIEQLRAMHEVAGGETFSRSIVAPFDIQLAIKLVALLIELNVPLDSETQKKLAENLLSRNTEESIRAAQTLEKHYGNQNMVDLFLCKKFLISGDLDRVDRRIATDENARKLISLQLAEKVGCEVLLRYFSKQVVVSEILNMWRRPVLRMSGNLFKQVFSLASTHQQMHAIEFLTTSWKREKNLLPLHHILADLFAEYPDLAERFILSYVIGNWPLFAHDGPTPLDPLIESRTDFLKEALQFPGLPRKKFKKYLALLSDEEIQGLQFARHTSNYLIFVSVVREVSLEMLWYACKSCKECAMAILSRIQPPPEIAVLIAADPKTIPSMAKHLAAQLTPDELRLHEHMILRSACRYGNVEMLELCMSRLTANDLRVRNNYCLRMAFRYAHYDVARHLLWVLGREDVVCRNNYAFRYLSRLSSKSYYDHSRLVALIMPYLEDEDLMGAGIGNRHALELVSRRIGLWKFPHLFMDAALYYHSGIILMFAQTVCPDVLAENDNALIRAAFRNGRYRNAYILMRVIGKERVPEDIAGVLLGRFPIDKIITMMD